MAAEALKAVAHSLTHADMSDIIAGRPVSGWRVSTRGQHSTQAAGCWQCNVQMHHILQASALPALSNLQTCVHAANDTCCAGLCAVALCPAVLQEDEALQALRVISAALSTAQLKHLNLSDNALGEKGLRAAAAAFQHPVSLVVCCAGVMRAGLCLLQQPSAAGLACTHT